MIGYVSYEEEINVVNVCRLVLIGVVKRQSQETYMYLRPFNAVAYDYTAGQLEELGVLQFCVCKCPGCSTEGSDGDGRKVNPATVFEHAKRAVEPTTGVYHPSFLFFPMIHTDNRKDIVLAWICQGLVLVMIMFGSYTFSRLHAGATLYLYIYATRWFVRVQERNSSKP